MDELLLAQEVAHRYPDHVGHDPTYMGPGAPEVLREFVHARGRARPVAGVEVELRRPIELCPISLPARRASFRCGALHPVTPWTRRGPRAWACETPV